MIFDSDWVSTDDLDLLSETDRHNSIATELMVFLFFHKLMVDNQLG